MSRIKNCMRNRPRRKQRQEEARVRQEATVGRSSGEQLARLDAAGRTATRERAKLSARETKRG